MRLLLLLLLLLTIVMLLAAVGCVDKRDGIARCDKSYDRCIENGTQCRNLMAADIQTVVRACSEAAELCKRAVMTAHGG